MSKKEIAKFFYRNGHSLRPKATDLIIENIKTHGD